MAAPGDIGDLPEEGAVEGGLLHEAEALLQLAQGLVFLSQRLLQLHHLWGSPFSQGHQSTAWGQGADGRVWRQTCPQYAFLTTPPSGTCICLCPCCPSCLEPRGLSSPLAECSLSIRNLAHVVLFWEASHYCPSSAGLSQRCSAGHFQHFLKIRLFALPIREMVSPNEGWAHAHFLSVFRPCMVCVGLEPEVPDALKTWLPASGSPPSHWGKSYITKGFTQSLYPLPCSSGALPHERLKKYRLSLGCAQLGRQAWKWVSLEETESLILLMEKLKFWEGKQLAQTHTAS